MPGRRPVEWPSVALCAGVYGGFGGLTWFQASLPAPLVAVGLALLLTLHASMQHEFIHGHPTRWRRLNRALAAVPLSLWLPFESYRRSHLVHHRDESLTDPLDDPESYYWSAEAWMRLGPLGRAVARLNTTLFGRLLFGPAWAIGLYLHAEARAVLAGERGARRVWAGHAAGAALVALWVSGVCGISPVFYLLAAVYPSTSLLLLRSFAEHRAADGVAERTAIVENAPVLGFLFLYNNLHAAHHERPLVPWYALPRLYRENRDRLVAVNGGLVYDGYGDVARRFLLVPHDAALHPREGADAARGRLHLICAAPLLAAPQHDDVAPALAVGRQRPTAPPRGPSGVAEPWSAPPGAASAGPASETGHAGSIARREFLSFPAHLAPPEGAFAPAAAPPPPMQPRVDAKSGPDRRKAVARVESMV